LCVPDRACLRQLWDSHLRLCFPGAGLFDMAKERARLAKQREKLDKELAAVAARVANQAFMSRAPPHVVAEV
jgi:valyl-tRNA synthetase